MSPAQELRAVAERINAAVTKCDEGRMLEAAQGVITAAESVGASASKSWLGYQASVYYRDFRQPPTGAYFSIMYGFRETFSESTRGDWCEYSEEAVAAEVLSRAGSPDIDEIKQRANTVAEVWAESKADTQSIIEAVDGPVVGFLSDQLDCVKAMSQVTAIDLARAMHGGGQVISSDMRAAQGGTQAPPHVMMITGMLVARMSFELARDLAAILIKMSSHIERMEKRKMKEDRIGTNVFIGHGRSRLWLELKVFVEDRLNLVADEFNRVPVAGITNIARLSEMLDAAAIALVVLTAEDEQADGKLRARMNVVHEVGLFQGRLGFTRAIVLLEEGCEEFSNINGLGQIRFPKNNIKAAFQEIREVIEREGLV